MHSISSQALPAGPLSKTPVPVPLTVTSPPGHLTVSGAKAMQRGFAVHQKDSATRH
jgi:hypothetical protein